MAITIVQGMVDSVDPLAGETRVDMRESITMLDPQESQFTTMMMRVASEKANSHKVEWMEDQLFPRHTALAAAITGTGVTAFTVTTNEGYYLRVGDVVRIATTGEAIEVTAVAASAFSGVRSIGSVAAATAAAGAEVVVVGNASVEGARSGTRKITQRVGQYNYCQIVRHPYGFTETLLATAQYGGSALMKERKKKAVEHKRQLEYLNFWGARDYQASQGTNSTEPQRFCGGLFEFISSYVTDAGGTFDKGELQDFLRNGLQHGNEDKVLFASPLVGQVLSEFLQDNWIQTPADARLWGAKVHGVISGAYSGAEVPVVIKRDWNDFSTASNQYGGWAFLVDMGNVTQRVLRSTKLKRGIQDNDADEYAEELITELSLEVRVEKTHAILKGVTG